MKATDAADTPSSNLGDLQSKAAQVAALLKALAHPDRLMLLCHLLQGEQCVAELGDVTGVRQPSLSQQLGILRSEGLVSTRRDGKFIYYQVSSEPVRAVLTTLYQHYCGPSGP